MKYPFYRMWFLATVALITSHAFAGWHKIFLEDCAIDFDSDSLQIKFQSTNEEPLAIYKRSGKNVSQILSPRYETILSPGVLTVNGRIITDKILIEKVQEQQRFLEAHAFEYDLQKLTSSIKEQPADANRFLLLYGNLTELGPNLDSKAFFSLVEFFHSKSYAALFLFEHGRFESLDLSSIISTIAKQKGTFNDRALVGILSMAQKKYPETNPDHFFALVQAIQDYSSKLKAIDEIANGGALVKFSSGQLQELVKSMGDDYYKLKVLNIFSQSPDLAKLTSKQALELIQNFHQASDKEKAIRHLQDSLRIGIEGLSGNGVAPLKSLADFSQQDPFKKLDFHSIVALLTTARQDGERNIILNRIRLRYLDAANLTLLLTCYTRDEGKLLALNSIYHNLAPACRSSIRRNATLILDGFQEKAAKTAASKILEIR